MIALIACGGSKIDSSTGSAGSTAPRPEPGSPTEPGIDADQDGVEAGLDCDDADPTRYPGAPEHCGDGRITDCDRSSESGVVTVDGLASYDDLSAALAAAAEGADVLVCPGIYAGAFEIPRALTLRSLEGAASTTLTAERVGTTLTVPGGARVEGFTVRDGAAVSGGGVRIVGEGRAVLEAVVIAGNRAVEGGGLSVLDPVTVELLGVQIRDNEADTIGGGILAGPGSAVELDGSVVEANVSAGSGGGVYLEDATLIGGSVSSNRSTASGYAPSSRSGPSGGGVHAAGQSAVSGTEISDNRAAMGSGLGITEGEVVLLDVQIHDNAEASIGGAGVHVVSAVLSLEGATEVYANRGSESGGGLSAWDAVVVGGVFRDNTAAWGGGGATLVGSTLADAMVTGNQASFGGGIALWNDSVVLGGTIASNVASTSGGGIDALGEGESGRIEEVTISDNQASEGGGICVTGLRLALDRARVIRNVASERGGGIAVLSDATATAIDCDLGAEADDNTPEDVAVEAGSVYSYGMGSFACDAAACQDL